MSRKKKPDHVNHERWLVSYADFITLMFAFFVVLYSTAHADHKKAARLSAAIEGAFQELGVFAGSAPGPVVRGEIPPVAGSNPEGVKSPEPVQVVKSNANGSLGMSGGVDVAKLKRQLETALGDEIRKHEVQMRVTPEGLVVSLREVGFFRSGDDILLPGAQSTLTRIVNILKENNFQIRVEGHTDNVPIHTARFRSNWELSTSRATEVVSMLVEKYGYDPSLVSAAGYSQYRPVAANDSEEGRKVNRRVDLIVVSKAK